MIYGVSNEFDALSKPCTCILENTYLINLDVEIN